MSRRGRPSQVEGMWKYLLAMNDEMKANPSLSRRAAAKLVVQRDWRHMPNDGTPESTIKLLERHHKRHQRRLNEDPAIKRVAQSFAAIELPKITIPTEGLEAFGSGLRKAALAIRAAFGPLPPRN